MRMRFCKENGELEFDHKLDVDKTLLALKPGFCMRIDYLKKQKFTLDIGQH